MYHDRAWLYKEYVDKQKSTTQIAKDLGVSHKTISRWLHKLDIPVRTVHEALDITYDREHLTREQKKMAYYLQKHAAAIQPTKPNMKFKGEKQYAK